MAIFLPIRLPRGNLAGTVMILADMKSLGEGTMERIVTPQVRAILVKIAMFMRKSMPAGETTSKCRSSTARRRRRISRARRSSRRCRSRRPQTLGPREVEQILELEVEATPPRAPAPAAVNSPPAGPAGGRKVLGAGAGAAPPTAKAALRGNVAPASFPTAKAAQGASKAVAALGAVLPERPEAEVLQFDANISIPTAKARPAAPDGGHRSAGVRAGRSELRHGEAGCRCAGGHRGTRVRAAGGESRAGCSACCRAGACRRCRRRVPCRRWRRLRLCRRRWLRRLCPLRTRLPRRLRRARRLQFARSRLLRRMSGRRARRFRRSSRLRRNRLRRRWPRLPLLRQLLLPRRPQRRLLLRLQRRSRRLLRRSPRRHRHRRRPQRPQHCRS